MHRFLLNDRSGFREQAFGVQGLGFRVWGSASSSHSTQNPKPICQKKSLVFGSAITAAFQVQGLGWLMAAMECQAFQKYTPKTRNPQCITLGSSVVSILQAIPVERPAQVP